MARRLYVAPIVGAGTASDPFRSKVTDYNVDHRLAGYGPGQDTQVGELMLAVADTDLATHTAISADVDIRPFPVRVLATAISDLTPTERIRASRIATDMGFAFSDVGDLRELARRAGARRNPRFQPEDI